MKPSEFPSFALCAAPASEMFIWMCGDLYRWRVDEKNAELKYDLAGNIIGAVFLGVCAFDKFPGARLWGAISFIAYSHFTKDQKNPYWTSQLIQKAWEHKVKTIILFASVCAAYRYTPQETVSKMRDIFSKVFTNV